MARSALWPRVGWVTKAVLAGVGGLLLSRTARLRPGQRAVVRLVGGRELVRLAVDYAAPRPARAALAPPVGEPAPLSERDVARVRDSSRSSRVDAARWAACTRSSP